MRITRLLLIFFSWNVASCAGGSCPRYHTPQVPIQSVLGKTAILRCDLGKGCYEGMWLNNKYGDRMDASMNCTKTYCVAADDNESRNTLYLYNLTYEQIGSYDCVCKEPNRSLYFCYDLTAVCQLEMKVGHTQKVYNGSYLSNDVQRTYSVDIKEWSSFDIRCQQGAHLTSNCTENSAIASMSLNGCTYTCSLPMAAGVDPCIVTVILQVNVSMEEEFFIFSSLPVTVTDKPTKTPPRTDRLPPSRIRVTQVHKLTTAEPVVTAEKKRLIGPLFPASTPLHTKFISILILCTSIGVMLLLVATSVVRFSHIHIKGEGKYKADVYRPGSIYGQPQTKDYGKCPDVISDELDTSTSGDPLFTEDPEDRNYSKIC